MLQIGCVHSLGVPARKSKLALEEKTLIFSAIDWGIMTQEGILLVYLFWLPRKQ